jgi:YHS domain-containing protein
MSKLTMPAVALFFFTLTGALSAQQATPAPPPDALDGVDVVVLIQTGKEVFGKSEFRSSHGGFNYLFSSAETKAAFEKTPQKYEIQLGGLCARMGGTVTGNPSDYVVHDGRIYIFGSDTCHKLFVADPSKYLPKPAAPIPATGAAVSKGRVLLDKAAAAHGGAKLDAMNSYVESWTVTQERQTGPVSIPNKNIWRFPHDARNERVLPLASGPLSLATTMTAAGAWGGNGERVSAAPTAVLPAVERTLWRDLIALLRVRRDTGVRVAALGPLAVEGVSLERVRVIRGGVDVTLLVEPTGRVRSMSFSDRKNDGEFGDIAIVYGDFKPVEGVLVPFSETATFNGAPNPTLTRRLDSILVNAPIDAKLFAPPAGVGK